MFSLLCFVILLPSILGFGEEIDYTDAAGNVLEHFRVQNINPSNITIYELCFEEYMNDYLLQEQYWHDIPTIGPMDETLMIPYFFKDIGNEDVIQKWTVVLEFENNTYITREPAVTKYSVDDQGHLSRIVLDLKKDRMQIKPPISKFARVDMKMKKGRLNNTNLDSLLNDIADLKKLLMAFIVSIA